VEDGKITGVDKAGKIVPGGELDMLGKLFSGTYESILEDQNNKLDLNQIDIFKTILKEATAKNLTNYEDIRYALNLTGSIDWSPDKEMSLARAIVNRGEMSLWQEAFGRDLIPDNARIQVGMDSGTIKVDRIAGLKGSMEIDFKDQEIFLSKLFDGSRALDSSRGINIEHFDRASGDTFGEAFAKTKTLIDRAKKDA
jgi:hypothetical protein